MTNGIDTPMHRVQPAAHRSIADRSPTQPDLQELRSRHDPVLALRKLGDHPVRVISPRPLRVMFYLHIVLSITLVVHAASLPARPAPAGRRSSRIGDRMVEG